MSRKPPIKLRFGWTTGACASAATKAALEMFWGGKVPKDITITLPKGETPTFSVNSHEQGVDFARAGIIKDAGDDPDVTHGVEVIVTVSPSSGGLVFKAGEGVGIVTKPGLPLAVGEPAINPVPREMMGRIVAELAQKYRQSPDITLEVSIPGGAEIALKTWNPRLGIKGGLSILGTTGIVRPFSCAAWIASIHRGVDVARATGLNHVAGCTGATSEKSVQDLLGLPDHAMLDMGDFVGGLLKYLRKHPVKRLTIGGGIGKMTKLAQGAIDLHSGRSQVDFLALGKLAHAGGLADVSAANTALEALEIAGDGLAELVAHQAIKTIENTLAAADIAVSVVVINREGRVLTHRGKT